jgi:hypothetical protein
MTTLSVSNISESTPVVNPRRPAVPPFALRRPAQADAPERPIALTPDRAAALLEAANHPGRNLDRCPACKTWVGPRKGVCNNSRCDLRGHQVQSPKPWPVAHTLDELLTPPAQRLRQAADAFKPALCYDWHEDPVAAYLDMRRDADRLHALARRAGKSLAEGESGFDAELRKELARRARIALERLPLGDLQRIAYAVGFRFPTLTQNPADTGRPSSLAYWLNPLYRHGTAGVVQAKTMERWGALNGPERVRVLLREAELHIALKKDGHAAPPPADKYGATPGYPEFNVIAETRLEMLSDLIAKVAWKLARPSGEDHGEIVAEMTFNVLEKAAQDPNLLLQKAAYVVNAGKWPVLNRFEAAAKLPGVAFSDELAEELAEMMLGDPDGCVKGTGALNLAEVMRRTGWSFWKAKDRVTKMRRRLAMAAGGTA